MTAIRTCILSVVCALVVAAGDAASAGDAVCAVDRFQGATSPAGAEVHMRVLNIGRPCTIANHGMPAERAHPAESGAITEAARHGTAAFSAPDAVYMPAAGFAGSDAFAYEAFAKGRNDERLRLRVRVKVDVVAP
ncbi:MAG TPA: hypothetical protein VGI48_16010 [Caldimonas sp.]